MNEDPAVEAGEIEPSGIDRVPVARVGLGVLAFWLLLQVAMPLSYYLSDDVYDERFAWRMFSAVRVQECALGAQETTDGVTHPIPLAGVLPAPWISLLQRGRPAVVRRFLAWRCASDASPSAVELTHTCRSAAGTPLPAVHRSIDCTHMTYDESHDE